MAIRSNWKLTFDPAGSAPLVIVDFGGIHGAEFAFPWRQVVNQHRLVNATNARRHARGNVATALSLETWEDHASDAAARLWCVDMQMTLDDFAGVTSTLRLEIEGSAAIYTLAQATIDEVEIRRRIQGVARTQTQWTIGGAGWSVA